MIAGSLEYQEAVVVIVANDQLFLESTKELVEKTGRKVRAVSGLYEAKEAASTASVPTIFLIDDFLQARNIRRLIRQLREYARVPIECVIVTNTRNPDIHAAAYDMDVYPFCREFFVGSAQGIDRAFIAFEQFMSRRLFRSIDRVTDTITGAYSRRGGETLWVQVWNGAKRDHAWLSCIYLDVNDFKSINDSFQDHAPGDNVLRAVEKAIRRHVRMVDVIIRYGDEFSILLSNKNKEDVEGIAERIKAEVGRAPIEVKPGAFLSVSVSIGVASSSPEELSPNPDHLPEVAIQDCEKLRQAADNDMYKDKQWYKENKKCKT